jgi:hypothetical protein
MRYVRIAGGSAARRAAVLAGESPAGAIPRLAPSSYPTVLGVTWGLEARTYKPKEGWERLVFSV